MPSIPTGDRQLRLANLENLGSTDRGDITYSNTANKLLKIAGTFLSAYENTLTKRGHVSSGQSLRLMKVGDLEVNSDVMAVNVLIPEYLRYQNDGVNGTEVNHGSRFSYKNKMPPIAPIMKWVRREIGKMRRDKYAPIKRAKAAGQRKAAAVSSIDKEVKSLAFAIAKNIQKKGIKPTKDLEQAAKITERIFRKEISEGLKIDVINAIKK